MSDSPRRSISNVFIGLAGLLVLLGIFFGNGACLFYGSVIAFLWAFGKLLAFILRSFGLR